MTSAISEDLLDALRTATPPRDGRPYLVPVPDCEPPYDELPPPTAAFRPSMLQGAVPLHPKPAVSAEAAAQRSTPVLAVGSPVASAAVAQPVASPQDPCGRPGTAQSARAIAGAAARILIEALCGARPVRQLAGTCSAPVLTTLGRRVRVGGSIPRLMSVHVTEPAAHVAEVAAVYRDRERVAALAFRLETVGDKWRVTQLQLA